ncbi:acyl-CoA dehydrogenase family protein [Acidocella sp.]|uniref:acyl-CoA dehydrogenase family protein n=1 Tax=Acidocella sp. TaxID=50710 RepID=UPI00262C186C|nr:acyl-CoA dehydrogenase family protein [Acidocella sp.]
MEFGWSPEQSQHRARVRALLARELPADWDDIAVHGPGSDAQTAFSKIFCKKLANEGLLISHWPREYGGNDMTVWDQFIMGEELWAAGEPRGPQYMNVNWIGPVLMRYGNAAQKAEYFPQIASGSVIWCQGFSEPSAGSDLASLRTRADKVEGGYLVNGAKVWTSYAGLATHCFLLARTASAGKGAIVILLLDMASPGVQVKQIPALIGEGDIHEVFFTDVFVPAQNLLGEEGQAWEIITFALQNERIGIPRYAFSRRMLDRAAEKLKADGRFENPVVRDRAGRALALCEAARMMVYRVVHQRATQAPQDAYGNLARWAIIQADHAVNDFMTEFMPEGLLGEDQMQIAHHQRAIAAGIASGAAEIQLNLAARRYLDLPSEPRRGL